MDMSLAFTAQGETCAEKGASTPNQRGNAGANAERKTIP
jgi:hypothetical protein